MRTHGLRHPWRRRVKRAARKLARTHPADVRRAVRAMDQRDRARSAGWDDWLAHAQFVVGDPDACISGMEPWEPIAP